jgi:predicted acyl esterase
MEANCFQTGSNKWKSYNTWPPAKAETKKLYAYANYKAGFSKPEASRGAVLYTSDPAKPVPYRTRPIEATYGQGSRWAPGM